jgi:hypothetical protein
MKPTPAAAAAFLQAGQAGWAFTHGYIGDTQAQIASYASILSAAVS